MMKIYFTILTVAALSSAAYANDRVDRRDSDTCMGKYCNNVKQPSASTTLTVISPLAVDEKDFGLSNYERMKKISEENSHGRH